MPGVRSFGLPCLICARDLVSFHMCQMKEGMKEKLGKDIETMLVIF